MDKSYPLEYVSRITSAYPIKVFACLALAALTLVPCYSSAATVGILSQNMNRLFDDVDNGNREKVSSSSRFNRRVKAAAKRFAEEFHLPQIIALQEIENSNVLRRIANRIQQQYGARYQTVVLPGQDISGIRTGFLIAANWSIVKTESLFRDAKIFASGNPLFSRPPLLVELCYLQKCLSVMNLHLRSMRGIGSSAKGRRVSLKRKRQAEKIAQWINRFQQVNSEASLLILGDLNALTPPDQFVDVAGIIRGAPDNRQTQLIGDDLLNPDLIDLTLTIPEHQRYSYIYRKKRQQLDYMLVNQDFNAKLQTIEFSPVRYRFSDHAGLIAQFSW